MKSEKKHRLMKRAFTYLILTNILLTLSFSQAIEENERKLIVEHKVKTRTNTDYSFTKGKFSKNGRLTSVTSYDNMGYVLETKAYNMKGEVSTLEKYEYDNAGNRTLYERQSLSGEYKKASEYDTENKLIEEYGYDGSATFRTNLKYDEKSRVLEITYYIADDVDEKRVYSYNGNTATVKIFKQGKHLTSKVDLVFNEAGEVLSEVLKSLDNKVLESKSFEYNSSGNIVKEVKYKNGEFFYEITYKYDANQNLLSVSEKNRSADKFEKKQYNYDDQNRVTEYKWKRNPENDYNIKAYKYGEVGVCEEVHTFYPRTSYTVLTKYEYTFY